MFNKILTPQHVLGLLLLITVLISLQQYFLPERDFWEAMRPQYNNYLIFKYSFSHLVDEVNLYSLHLEEHGDLFKYSPTFALFMGLFYYLPDWLGLLCWNLLNMLFLYAGIRSLPGLKDKAKVYILLYVTLELIGNLQNEQSNALMTGLILLTYVSFEKKHVALAAMWIMMSVYIKLFGLVAASLFLFYPGKKKFMLWMALWCILLWVLPLLVTSAGMLVTQYESWFGVLQSDHQARVGFSLLGILNKWFGLNPSKVLLLISGVLLFCLGYLRWDAFRDQGHRLLFLSSILIWVILFNHTAESSGYILAMTGCAIWYFTRPGGTLNTVLIILAFVVVSLFSTDLMPASIRNNYIYPYYIRTLPVVLIWIAAMVSLLKKQPAT